MENLESIHPISPSPCWTASRSAAAWTYLGHLWLDGVPALPYLEKALPRTRVIHMHGIGERDHASLEHVDPNKLEPVFRMLLSNYRGMLTLEVFSEPEFLSSIEAIDRALKHIDSTPKSTFILGGARSGKSSYTQQLAHEHGGSVLYVATATAGDEEMKTRIENHRAERPAAWRTLEAPLSVGQAIQQELADQPADVILLDCMTLLATNVLLQLPETASEKEASETLAVEVEALLACMDRSKAEWIIVSNEVGLGLVPPYPLGRIYRDALGRANQRLAASADKTILMVAGIPALISSKLSRHDLY